MIKKCIFILVVTLIGMSHTGAVPSHLYVAISVENLENPHSFIFPRESSLGGYYIDSIVDIDGYYFGVLYEVEKQDTEKNFGELGKKIEDSFNLSNTILFTMTTTSEWEAYYSARDGVEVTSPYGNSTGIVQSSFEGIYYLEKVEYSNGDVQETSITMQTGILSTVTYQFQNMSFIEYAVYLEATLDTGGSHYPEYIREIFIGIVVLGIVVVIWRKLRVKE